MVGWQPSKHSSPSFAGSQAPRLFTPHFNPRAEGVSPLTRVSRVSVPCACCPRVCLGEPGAKTG